jgi:hypothetical protein
MKAKNMVVPRISGEPRAQALKMNGLRGVFLKLSVDIQAT